MDDANDIPCMTKMSGDSNKCIPTETETEASKCDADEIDTGTSVQKFEEEKGIADEIITDTNDEHNDVLVVQDENNLETGEEINENSTNEITEDTENTINYESIASKITGALKHEVEERMIEDSQENFVLPDDISKTPDEGPVQPRLLSYPKSSFGSGKARRSFCANWYERFPWLEYSVSFNKVYCFACRHFNKVKNSAKKDLENEKSLTTTTKKKKPPTIYATTGFDRWAKANERMQRHNCSAKHLAATKPWQQYLKENPRFSMPNCNNTSVGESAVVELTQDNSKSKLDNIVPSKRKRKRPTKRLMLEAEDIEDGVPTWCTCNRCQVMFKIHECVCCCDVPEIKRKLRLANPNLVCITDHPGFAFVCLNHWVLQVAYYHHKQDHGEPAVTEDYERFRYIAYCQFVRWCWGYLQEDMHVPLPSCVVNRIKSAFLASSSRAFPSLDDLP